MSSTNAADSLASPASAVQWSKVFSRTHKAYYWFNASTGESRWTEPSDISVPSSIASINEENVKTSGGGPTEVSASSVSSGSSESAEDVPSTKRQRISDSSDSVAKEVLASATLSKYIPIGPKVGIIVPFRDLHVEQKRSEHLRTFVPAMTRFLTRSNQPFVIYIVEQSDDKRKFNRGQLLNIGFDVACKEMCDIFIFHDVDLIPSEDLLSAYTTVPSGSHPVHIAKVWDRYNSAPNYFGGIIAFSKEQFQRINGFPNNFWGWGGEDDELYSRSKEVGLTTVAPSTGTITDLEEMNLDQKLKFLRAHQEWKCMNKWEMLDTHATTWRTNGLKNLSYVLNKDECINGQVNARMIRVTLSD